MKTSTLWWAAGAFAAAAALVLLGRRTAQAAPAGGDAERMAGVRAWYGADAGQQAGTQAAVQDEWRQLDSVFKSQPDFWV